MLYPVDEIELLVCETTLQELDLCHCQKSGLGLLFPFRVFHIKHMRSLR